MHSISFAIAFCYTPIFITPRIFRGNSLLEVVVNRGSVLGSVLHLYSFPHMCFNSSFFLYTLFHFPLRHLTMVMLA
jgi:hypothetical protein